MSADLANGIQNSVNALIASEANYDGIFDRLHTALSAMPAKLDDIRALLTDYNAAVRDIPADNSYRQSANELYVVINGIYNDASNQALAAMEVCCDTAYNTMEELFFCCKMFFIADICCN